MNYLKLYINLIRIAEQRGNIDSPTEKHHVFPRSIYGNNSRTVTLSIREHLIVHLLLWKLCEQRYGKDHWKTKKMCFAASQLGWKRRCGDKVNSKVLEATRLRMSEFLSGENNPAKTQESREKISNSKRGVKRPDMVGKHYFGANEETKKQIIEKMRISKTGVKIPHYPKNRNSPPCSKETAEKIRLSKIALKVKYTDMSDDEFYDWVSKINPYRKDGKRNPNITRVLVWRNMDVDEYYRRLEQ